MYVIIDTTTNMPLYIAQTMNSINLVVKMLHLEHYIIFNAEELENQYWFKRVNEGYTFYRVDYDPDERLFSENNITVCEQSPLECTEAKNVYFGGRITIYVWAKNEEAARKSMLRLRSRIDERVYKWPDIWDGF